MAEQRIEDVLDTCIDDVQNGRASLEACLERYPTLRQELEPLLRLAVQISPIQLVADPARKLAARARFVEALYETAPSSGLGGLFRQLWSKPFTAGVIGALALFTSGGAVYAAADQSLPGDPLYSVKVALDDAKIAVAPTDEAKLQIEIDVAGRRAAEVAQALESQRPEAAQAAAGGYEKAVNQAQQRLERLPAPAATAVAAQVQEKLEQQAQSLAVSADVSPPNARIAVERARAKAAKSAPAAAAKADASPRPTNTPSARGATSTAAPPPTARPTTAPRIIADLNLLEQQTGQVSQQSPVPTRDTDNGDQSTDGDQSSVSGRDASNASLERDLQVQLEGVRTALADGRTQAARSRLDAFRNQLETLRRTRRISDELYQQLSTAALRLRDDIVVNPTNTPNPRRGTPQATATPRRTPTQQPRRSPESTIQNVNTPAPPTTVVPPTAPSLTPLQVQAPR